LGTLKPLYRTGKARRLSVKKIHYHLPIILEPCCKYDLIENLKRLRKLLENISTIIIEEMIKVEWNQKLYFYQFII